MIDLFRHASRLLSRLNQAEINIAAKAGQAEVDTAIDAKADKTNVLQLDNTTEFTPDADYEPATKKYVDDNAGGGAFTDLSDVPASYSGEGNKFVKVNAGETALEFAALAGGGDMLASTYDPTSVAGDVFDVDNHNDGTINKVFTATEKTKLASIAAGAEVNVNADWNGSGDDSEILNKPTIPVISDDAYNETTWNEDLNGASKNTLRDKFSTVDSAIGNKADDSAVVHDTGNETVAGIKTFSSFPITPSSAPTADYEAANKKYVDDNAGGISLSDVYPVGSIYIEVTGTNPGTTFGFGIWTAFGTGRTLVGIDSGQTEFDTVEETGGAKTHTLIEAEIPAHTHTLTNLLARSATTGAQASEVNAVADASATLRSPYVSDTKGGGGAHNNLQPYIVVYMWKRTA